MNIVTTHEAPHDGLYTKPPTARAGRRSHASEAAPSRPLADLTSQLTEQLVDGAHHVSEKAHEVYAEVKPRLRGWSHAIAVPLALIAGIVLVTHSRRASCGSALRSSPCPHWSCSPSPRPCTAAAGHGVPTCCCAGWTTRTSSSSSPAPTRPSASILAPARTRHVAAGDRLAGALLGIVFRVLWHGAPRWLYTPVYLGSGLGLGLLHRRFASHRRRRRRDSLAAAARRTRSAASSTRLKRPNPFPRWFGFHEVFHALTIVAFAVHYAAISIATYAVS